MSKYIVSTTIQSANIDDNAPVTVRWYNGDSLAAAMAAMAGAAAHHEEVDARVPAAARYSTLGVHLSIEQVLAPSTETAMHYDTEVALSTDGSDIFLNRDSRSDNVYLRVPLPDSAIDPVIEIDPDNLMAALARLGLPDKRP